MGCPSFATSCDTAFSQSIVLLHSMNAAHHDNREGAKRPDVCGATAKGQMIATVRGAGAETVAQLPAQQRSSRDIVYHGTVCELSFAVWFRQVAHLTNNHYRLSPTV